MPRYIAIMCDRCGAKIAWYPADDPWINDILNVSIEDSHCFVAYDRENGTRYRDLCPECAEQVFWMPHVADVRRPDHPPAGPARP